MVVVRRSNLELQQFRTLFGLVRLQPAVAGLSDFIPLIWLPYLGLVRVVKSANFTETKGPRAEFGLFFYAGYEKIIGIKVTHNDVANLKLLIILIDQVVPLLRDRYQNKLLEGVWTPNGTFLTPCSLQIFVLESLCLSGVSFFYIKLETPL